MNTTISVLGKVEVTSGEFRSFCRGGVCAVNGRGSTLKPPAPNGSSANPGGGPGGEPPEAEEFFFFFES
jgi:hypothetical protein